MKGFWKWILIMGFVAGISFAHRFVLIVIPLLALGLFLLINFKKVARDLSKFVRMLVVFAAVFFIALFAFDPFTAANGFSGIPMRISWSLTPVTDPGFVALYNGKIFPTIDLPRDYLPRFITITTPLIILTLLFVGIGFIAFKIFKDRDLVNRSIYFLLLTSLFLPIAAVIVLNSQSYDAWRHFLFLTIPMVAIASFGFDELLTRAGKLQWLLVVVLIVNLGWITKSYVGLHPYEYVYFNELVGGLKGATGEYETDYWAKSMKDVAVWFNGNLGNDQSKQYKIATNCANPFQLEYYLAPNMFTVEKLEDGDFYICPRVSYDKLPNETPIHLITREGVPINYIKKVP